MKKKIITWLIIVVLFFSIITSVIFVFPYFIIFWSIRSNHMNMPDRNTSDVFLHENIDSIVIINNYLISSRFDRININRSSGANPGIYTGTIEMFTGLEYGRVSIEDDEVIEAIRYLFQYVYSISKRGNVIDFLSWSTRNHGRGIVYYIDGNIPGDQEFMWLTEIEPLSIDNWYFYVENFNEWRTRNRN